MTDTLSYHEARLASALECNADLNRAFFAKALEAEKLRDELAGLVADILAGRTNISVNDCMREYHALRAKAST